MFNASIDDEAVACVCVKDLASDVDPNGSANDINQLMMRMTVARTYPVRVEEVTNEHEMVSIREDLTAHSRLGREGLWGVVLNESHHIGLRCLVQANRWE